MLIGIHPCHAESSQKDSDKQSLIGVSSPVPLVTAFPSQSDRTTDDIQAIDRLNPISLENAEVWQYFMEPQLQSDWIADRITDKSPQADEPDTESNRNDHLWRSGRPDGHAPIGIMGDHTHEVGEFMLSYRFMRMDMAGNRDGTTDLTSAQVLEQFPVTPTDMTTDMHMLGAMYAPTEELTMSVMAPYLSKSMNHVTRMGGSFTTQTDGFGDIKLVGLYKVFDQDRQRVHLSAGMSFPVGSTNQRDDTPAGPNQVLPYPMQLGSGTFDLLPGITYLGQSDQWSWGGQALGTIRLGTNGNRYRLGNRFNLTGWGARRWNDWFSTSVRLIGNTRGNLSGADPRLDSTLIPTADPNRRGGTRLDAGFGLNFLVNKGTFAGHRLAIEFALPVYQSLDGPQLETDWLLTLGWQKAF